MEKSDNKKSKEIDVIGILRTLLHEWKTISVFVLVFAVLGVVSALTRTKIYKTDVILAPETSGSDLSSLMDSWGNLIGQSFGQNSSDAIYPELYPNIFTSTPFLIDMFDIPVVLKDSSKTLTYYNHIKDDYKPGLLSYPFVCISKIIKLFKNEEQPSKEVNPFYLTNEQENICNHMRKNVQCVVDQRTSLITISVTDIDEVVAATIADTVTSRLQEYIIDYRTKKARHDLKYISEMYLQAQKEYFDIQAEYIKFSDANMNAVKASQKARLENLEKEMQLKMEIYSNLAQQKILAQQRVQERVPVFTVIQPSIVQLKPVGMSGLARLVLFCFLGVVFGSIWCLYLKSMYKAYIANKKNKMQ